MNNFMNQNFRENSVKTRDFWEALRLTSMILK